MRAYAVNRSTAAQRGPRSAPWAVLRAALGAAAVMSLAACGTVEVRSTFYEPMYGVSVPYSGTVNVWSATGWSDPRLLDPHFYMDEEDAPRWLLMYPAPNQ